MSTARKADATPHKIIVLILDAKPVTDAERKAATDRINNTGMWLSYEHTHFGLAWARCKGKLTISRQVPTMSVKMDGAITANPDFVMSLQPKELGFVLCHEILHVAGDHMSRAIAIGVCNAEGLIADEGKAEAWGLATDMATNYALVTDRVGEMPKGKNEGVMPPRNYDGARDSESIYLWLMKQAKNMNGGATAQNVAKAAGLKGASGQSGQALVGCLPGPGEQQGDSEGKGQGQGQSQQQTAGSQVQQSLADAAQIPLGDTIRAALSQGIGHGSAVAELLTPRPPRCRWETVLQSGFTTASLEATNRIFPTYARSGRRESLLDGGVVRGKKGGHPSVALVMDVSGSMDRTAVAQIIGEALEISRLVGAELYLAVHTEKLEWSGWVRRGDVETLRQATKFTGGTDAGPAYAAVKAAKPSGFDCLVHFTDTFLPYWPEVPAKRLVVGATGLPTGAEPHCKPPPGAKILRVEV